MAENGSTPTVSEALVAQERRPTRRIWRQTRTTGWLRLLAPKYVWYVLATVLSLGLSACAARGPVPPVSTVASSCICWCVSGSEAYIDTTPSKALAVSPPITADGVVYVTYAVPDTTHNPRKDTYGLAALRAQDGLPLWRIPATSSTRFVTAADGVLIVDGLAPGRLVGLRARDGATLWRASLPIGAQVGGRSNSSGGILYAIGGRKSASVLAFQVADGRILWRTDIQRSADHAPPPVVDDANVYVETDDGSVVALRVETGAIRWTAFPGSPASTVEWHTPLGSFGGELYVLRNNMEMTPAVVRLNVANGANDGVALYLDEGSQAFYPMLTADIFTTLVYPNAPVGPTLSGWRLSSASDGFPLPLWSVPERQYGGEIAPSAHDSQTFYIEFTTGPQEGTIIAYRLTDGVVLWRRQSLAQETSIVAGSRELFETAPGIDDVCYRVYRAPQVRALAAASGAVAWTRALGVTR